MREHFETCLREVLAHEGGYVNHPRDPGGCTNLGITLATYRAYLNRHAGCADVKRLTRAEAARIYRAGYWNAVAGDELPGGVDLAVFDLAVNSGPSRAISMLQRALAIKDTGRMDVPTLAAAQSHPDPAALAAQLCEDRLAWLKRLRTWRTFGRGWTRRVVAVQAAALALAKKKPAEVPV